MKRLLYNWSFRLLLFILVLFYFIIFFIGHKKQINNNNLTLQLTTRYSLNQMRKFAYENAITSSYRLKNLSFDYLLKNKNKRFKILK